MITVISPRTIIAFGAKKKTFHCIKSMAKYRPVSILRYSTRASMDPAESFLEPPLLDTQSEMESSRPWPWPRGSSRPANGVLGLGLGLAK